jgi:hypothetical protein
MRKTERERERDGERERERERRERETEKCLEQKLHLGSCLASSYL